MLCLCRHLRISPTPQGLLVHVWLSTFHAIRTVRKQVFLRESPSSSAAGSLHFGIAQSQQYFGIIVKQ